MCRTLACIMVTGLIFVFFGLYAFDVDLLIDAVGWLIVFNSVRVFRKLVPAFGPAHWVCVLLVAVSALQLFFTAGALATGLGLARRLAEAVFFALAGRGFGAWPAAGSGPTAGATFPAGKALSILCFIMALASLASAVLLFFPGTGILSLSLAACGAALRVAVLAGLLWFAFSAKGSDIVS